MSSVSSVGCSRGGPASAASSTSSGTLAALYGTAGPFTPAPPPAAARRQPGAIQLRRRASADQPRHAPRHVLASLPDQVYLGLGIGEPEHLKRELARERHHRSPPTTT